MKKRRIEVTRERWTRLRIESRGRVACPLCGGAPDLAFMANASQRTGVSEERLLRAVRAGVLPAWELDDRKVLICLGCVEKLKTQGNLC
jgi:hypothetical protein